MIFDDLSLIKAEVADLTNATATATENDGNNSLTFVIASPATGVDTNITLEESDDKSTGFVAVDAEQVIGSANFTSAEINTVKMIGYAGGKKYVKLKASATATNFHAVAIKGRNRHM